MWVYSKDTNVIFSYEDNIFGSANYLVKAFRTGPSGVLSWGGTILTACSVLSAKVRMNAAINPAGMSMLCWADNRQDGNGVYAQNINYDGTFGNPVGIITDPTIMPVQYSLEQNYPNPFNPSTKIKFDIPANSGPSSLVKLVVYDISGKVISTLVNQVLSPARYEVNFDASNLATGVYFYKLTTGSFSDTKKLMLLK
jgi:hypothetical protein